MQKLIKKGRNILCITHDIDMVAEYYDRIILLKDRKIIADGKPNQILTSKNINNLFNIKIKLLKHKKNWVISR